MEKAKDYDTAANLVSFFGTTTKVARALKPYKASVSKQLVEHWKNQGYVPAKWGNIIEVATGGNITAYQVMQSAIYHLNNEDKR